MQKDVVSLVTEVKNGSGEAFTRLSTLYSPLVTSVIAKYASAPTPDDAAYDDVRQEALIALYNAAMSYDTEQDGVSFGLYAKICIRNRVSSVLRKLSCDDRYVELPDEMLDDESQDPSRRFAEQEDALLLQKRIGSLLSPFESTVFARSLRGMSITEIAREMGRPVKSIDNALVRIRSKLRRLL